MDLYTARVIKRLRQWDISQATGINQSKVSLIENGYVTPTLEEKIKLATAVHLSVKLLWPDAKTKR